MVVNCKNSSNLQCSQPVASVYCSREVKLDGSSRVLGTSFFQ